MSRESVLRFDGVYFRKHESGVFFVLRFYKNGTVCGGYVSEDPERLKAKFTPDTANHGRGSYTIHENHISFSFVNEEGSIDYTCEMSRKTLKCNILSTLTRKNMKWDYIFTKFSI
jgi:hypothetical protein